jgi:cyclopropane-fatty-acyl-phospholipid synthase
MFEHMRDWESLLSILRKNFMHDSSAMFLHHFSHKSRAYPYDTNTWMGRYFFTGGIMPTHELVRLSARV